MVHGGEAAGHGWLIDTAFAWWFVGIWMVVVLAYGLARSRGDGAADPIRPSGPMA